MSVLDDLLLARVALLRIAEPTDIVLWKLVRDQGPMGALDAIRSGDVPPAAREPFAEALARVEPDADLEAATRHRIRFVMPEDDAWPHFAFAALERVAERTWARYDAGERTVRIGEAVPPLGLWVQGPADLPSLGVRSVGIVGSRACTAYGQHVAADLSRGLALRDFAIVSGGAYGIDGAAHRAALGASGRTVLVSAGGLQKPYPPSHAELYARVRDTGLVLSESPPGMPPKRRRFLTRNRLIAGLSTGTVIVEAAARSGAMNTAAHTRSLGRPLMAVPGPVTSVNSVGCHTLLSRGEEPAHLVGSVDDVLAVIGSSGDVMSIAGDAPKPASPDPRREILDRLDERACRLFDAFPARRAVDVSELAVCSGLSPLEVIRTLPGLELSGLIESAGGQYRIRMKQV